MPKLPKTYTSTPLDHLDFTSIHELPDSHAWSPPIDGHLHDEPIPVVDLRQPDVVAAISHASRTWGLFQVIGHGIPIHLLEVAVSECDRLFSLPLQQKLKASRGPHDLSGYGAARISCFFDKLMWSEGFTIIGSSVDEHARLLWPHDYRRFCDVIEEYKEEMKKLARKLTGLMLLPLGLSGNDVEQLSSSGITSGGVLQLNSYPVCPEPDRAMGLAAHTDSSLLTILSQSNTRGLQVLWPGDDEPDPLARWVFVPPIHGALVVNVGDLFQIFSNGKYRSSLHRAVVNARHHRFSMAYIHGPPPDVKVYPPKKLLGPRESLRYRPVTWPEYLRLKAEHFNEALELVKLPQETTVHGGCCDM